MINKIRIIIIPISLIFFGQCKEVEGKRQNCQVGNAGFPFGIQLINDYDSLNLMINFYQPDKVKLEIRSDTSLLLDLEGDFTYDITGKAYLVSYGTTNPIRACETIYTAIGVITIAQSTDSVCIGEKLHFNYQFPFPGYNISITGNCFNYDGFNY